MTSDWMEITQDLVNRFAAVTGDQQWIHTDPDRGATIAHGFLTLSLFSTLLRQTVQVDDVRMAVNYGLDRVRFLAPVMVGSRIRGRFERASSEERADGTKVVWHVTVESDASEKPCCVADWIVLYVRSAGVPPASAGRPAPRHSRDRARRPIGAGGTPAHRKR
jgi:acyl dehydratase